MYLRQSREELMDTVESMRNQLNALRAGRAESEAERKRLELELETLKTSLVLLGDRHERSEQENSRLKDRCRRMEQEVAELEDRLADCEENSGIEYALFKSFVEDASKRILLINAAYSIRYANTAALKCLGLKDFESVGERRIFDFLPFPNALKLKEKIDKVFLKGDKEKISDIAFQTPDGRLTDRWKVKIYRVRYQNRPSIKLELT
jgi:PAS domain-containing protein